MQILMQLKKKFSAPVICLPAQDKPEVSANLIKAVFQGLSVRNQLHQRKIQKI
jgi:hypothetical protein